MLVCLLAAILRLWAFDFTALKPEGYVSDFARVVEAGARTHLEQYCARLEKATGVQLALVTLPSLQGEPIEDVANALYRAWGVGRKQTHEGVLLLLAIRDRRSRLEVGYGLEPVIPDGQAGSILRAMRPALRRQHYGEALLAAAAEIGSRIAQAKGVTLEAPAPLKTPAPQVPRPPWALLNPPTVAVLLALVGLPLTFVLLMLFGMTSGGRRLYRTAGSPRDLMTALLLAGLANRSMDRRRGGGGFGGFDSGDSFGGFGGGDSGGGGASSSW